MRTLLGLTSALILTGTITGCGTNEEKIAEAKHRFNLVQEHKAASSQASERIKTAQSNPTLANFNAILPYMNQPSLMVELDGQTINGYSAVRKLLTDHPSLYQQALVGSLKTVAAELPEGDTIPDDKSTMISDYLKILIEAVSEKGVAAGHIPSVTLMMKTADGTNHTLGYLYPFGSFKLGDQVFLNKEKLSQLTTDLSKELGFDEMAAGSK